MGSHVGAFLFSVSHHLTRHHAGMDAPPAVNQWVTTERVRIFKER